MGWRFYNPTLTAKIGRQGRRLREAILSAVTVCAATAYNTPGEP
jgi:hypothetical protein